MEEFKWKRIGMPTTVEWCDPVSKMSHHIKKGEEIGPKRFGNSDSVLTSLLQSLQRQTLEFPQEASVSLCTCYHRYQSSFSRLTRYAGEKNSTTEENELLRQKNYKQQLPILIKHSYISYLIYYVYCKLSIGYYKSSFCVGSCFKDLY